MIMHIPIREAGAVIRRLRGESGDSPRNDLLELPSRARTKIFMNKSGCTADVSSWTRRDKNVVISNFSVEIAENLGFRAVNFLETDNRVLGYDLLDELLLVPVFEGAGLTNRSAVPGDNVEDVRRPTMRSKHRAKVQTGILDELLRLPQIL